MKSIFVLLSAIHFIVEWITTLILAPLIIFTALGLVLMSLYLGRKMRNSALHLHAHWRAASRGLEVQGHVV